MLDSHARRPSVLHVCQPTDGGAARCVEDYAANQAADGWNVVVACPSRGPLAEAIIDRGGAWVRWDAIREPNAPTLVEVRHLRRIVDEVRPAVVHLHSSKAGLTGRLAIRKRRPTLFQPHGWSFESCTGWLRRAAIAWERWAAGWADTIVCVSLAELRLGRTHGVHSRYQVVPNGIDVTAWQEAGREEKRAARRRLGLGDGFLAVCVGRLDRAKGQDVLLDAWSLLHNTLPDASVVLVGDGPDRELLKRRAMQSVRLVGHRSDVADWLAAADVAVVPSRWDGMALALLEAMARGRSVVATDVPGARECLGEAAGAIVPIEDSSALAAAIAERALEPDRTKREGREARRRAEARFDLRRTLALLADVYDEVLSVDGLRRKEPSPFVDAVV